MASGLCLYLRNKLVGLVHGTNWDQLATVYVGLATDVTDGGVVTGEPSGNNYARKSVANNNTTVWGSPSNGIVSNSTAAITFNTASGTWGTMTKFFVADAATNGNVLYWGDLTAPVTITSGITPTFAIGALAVSIALPPADEATITPPAEPSPSGSYVLYDNFNSEVAQWSVGGTSVNAGGITTNFLTANVTYEAAKRVLRSYIDVATPTGGSIAAQVLTGYGTFTTSMRLITRPGARMVWGVSDLAGAAQVTMDVRNTGTQYDCVLTTRASSTSTATTITLGDDPGLSYSVFKFVWAAGNVDFYINDVKVGTHTTNVPTASMYVLYENKVITSPPAEHGDGNSVMYVDYVTATSSAATGEYLLIDNFDALSSYWSKRNNTWDSSFAYTIFKPENVWIDAGKVVLRSNSLLHTGAEIWTSGKFMYGIYKCSAKFNQQPGTWIAPIWSYVWANPVQNEIDIEITKSGATTTAHFKTWHNYSDIEETWVLDFDPNDGYHTYEYRWTATAVTFYIDNVQRGQITKAEADADPGGSAWPNVEMAVYCQNWVQKNLSESVGDGISTLYIDWVSVEPNP